MGESDQTDTDSNQQGQNQHQRQGNSPAHEPATGFIDVYGRIERIDQGHKTVGGKNQGQGEPQGQQAAMLDGDDVFDDLLDYIVGGCRYNGLNQIQQFLC